MKKSYLIVGAVGLGLVFLSVILNFFFSFGASRSANAFLTALSEGRTADAYLMTARQYREVTKERDFRRTTSRWNLRDYKSIEDWETQPGGGQVTISASVKTRAGVVTPLLIGLTKEDGKWRINRLQGPPPAPIRYSAVKSLGYYRRRHQQADDPKNLPTGVRPSDQEVEKLIEATLLDLDRAMKADDFAEFHGKVAREWREDMSVKVFERVLRKRGQEKYSLSGLTEATPVFDPAPSLERGTLIARGKYRLPDNSVEFHFRYVREGSEWKLMEMWIGFRPLTPDELEDEDSPERIGPERAGQVGKNLLRRLDAAPA
jgi:hypothetical protein